MPQALNPDPDLVTVVDDLLRTDPRLLVVQSWGMSRIHFHVLGSERHRAAQIVDQADEAWDAMGKAERWAACMPAIERMRISPGDLRDVRFGDGRTVFDIINACGRV